MPAFPKGKSGNPKGRPKGRRNVAQQILEEVSRQADGTEPVTKLEKLIRTLIDKGLGGDNRSIEKILERVEALDAKLDRNTERRFDFTDADREVIAEIRRRLTDDPAPTSEKKENPPMRQ